MASIIRTSDGKRQIQFVAADGGRKTVRLGRCSQRAAEAIKCRLESIVVARRLGQPMDGDLCQWISSLDLTLAKKLAAVGLIDSPDKKAVSPLGEFLDRWLDARKGDYKPASIIIWGQAIRLLKEFFGAERNLSEIDAPKAEAFRQSLLAAGMRPATIHKRLQYARMFFEHAKRQQLIQSNPFEYVRHRTGDASERRAYVPAGDVMRVIEFAPNVTWKLLLVLSRFAGLRVPSEALSLRWQDVDWERGRLTVTAPKTEHLAGRGYRVIPLFPEIRPHLEAAFEEAPDGAEFVFPEQYRKRAQGPGGWANANLRTTLAKLVRRAGLEPWPRLWHSLRASCETDLSRKFPLATAAKWLGNTQIVAMRHYVELTDADFERAAAANPESQESALQKAQQYAHARGCIVSQQPPENPEKSTELPFSATCRKSLPYKEIFPTGLEPVTFSSGG